MAGMISNGGFLLVVALALFAVLDVASACGSTCVKRRGDGSCEYYSRRRYRVHRRYGRQAAEDDEYIRNYYGYNTNSEEYGTSCRKAICTNVIGYPSERINDAVNLVRRMMASHDPKMVEKRKELDPELIHFKSESHIKDSNEDFEDNVNGCRIHTNVQEPQEGISIEDEGHYLIVNIPSIQQRVQFIECLGGKSETCDVEGDTTCQQTYREEFFIALPANVRRHYEARDFKIKKFRIPNGCQCGERLDLVERLD